MLFRSLQIGCRVLVPFGQKKIYTAIVVLLHDNEPKGYRVKEIISMIDPKPILRYPQLKFWQWISDYYLRTWKHGNTHWILSNT